MDNLIETLSITVLFVILFSIPIFLFTILCLIKRNEFCISVNCWFCNSWTKVRYDDRNSFYCPFCLQYNGFNKDGGYNKIVEEQFDTSFNKQKQYTNVLQKTESSSNGLCLYCNNNQQLKIRQLANFTPLNEKNYDIEVEHFGMQLEKSYKLCKKCDKVLKKTLEGQQAWIFGNHIKNIKKNGLSLLKKSKEFKKVYMKSFVMHFLRYFLILISFIVLCQALNATVEYHNSAIKKYIPQIILPYTNLWNDWYILFSNMTKDFIENMSRKLSFHLIPHVNDMKIINNVISSITCLGLVLEIILLIWQSDFILWKINKILSWIILNIISLHEFHTDYFIFTGLVQMLCCITNIYSLGADKPRERRLNKTKTFTFKKLKVNSEAENDYSDTDEDIFSSYFKDSPSNKSYKSSKNLNSSCSQSSCSPIFGHQNMPQSTANINDTFATARSIRSSLFNTCSKNNSDSSGDELHNSLDNLHLSNSSFKLKSCTSPTILVSSQNRPILSPAKLKSITQSPWTAGGFWENNTSACPATTNLTNSSCSSSQTSGFVSNNDPVIHNPFNSYLFPREQSGGGNVEMASGFSEPTYHFKPIKPNCDIYQRSSSAMDSLHVREHPTPKQSQLHFRGNMFHPVLKSNDMLYIQANSFPSNNFQHSFGNISLRNMNVNSSFNSFSSSAVREKPVISSLFRNVPGISPEKYTFRDPQF